MWIKWKYNDHGHGGFRELEVPDDVEKTYGSVVDYICELGLVPTWSERFCTSRIKWEKIGGPKTATLAVLIANGRSRIDALTDDVDRWEKLLVKMTLTS
jgi:hypothetical protein